MLLRGVGTRSAISSGEIAALRIQRIRLFSFRVTHLADSKKLKKDLECRQVPDLWKTGVPKSGYKAAGRLGFRSAASNLKGHSTDYLFCFRKHSPGNFCNSFSRLNNIRQLVQTWVSHPYENQTLIHFFHCYVIFASF